MLALGRLSVSARCGSRPSTARVVPVAELRSNVIMLAKLAKLMKIPVTTTASEPNGADGPLMAELKNMCRTLSVALNSTPLIGLHNSRQVPAGAVPS
jgi:hypothetical protein